MLLLPLLLLLMLLLLLLLLSLTLSLSLSLLFDGHCVADGMIGSGFENRITTTSNYVAIAGGYDNTAVGR